MSAERRDPPRCRRPRSRDPLRRGPAAAEPARPRSRVLLIEDVEGLGADVQDGRARARWLREAGHDVRWLALAPPGEPERPGSGECVGVWARGPGTRGRLVSLARAHRFDLAILASSVPGAGAAADGWPASPPLRWWPTGLSLAVPSRWHPLRRAGAQVLEGIAEGGLLSWSAVEREPSEARSLPLWDGELILAPEGLGGRRGRAALAAFAVLARDWSGVDLVSWTAPRGPETQRALALGIGARVHHVGAPTRQAEGAWWTQASAAVLWGEARISAGLVLRALRRGCPLLWVAPRGAARRVARELTERGCAFEAAARPAAVTSALGRILERGAEAREVIERGRRLAAERDPAGLAARLGGLAAREDRRLRRAA